MDVLLNWAQSRGYAMTWCAPELLDQVRSELTGRHAAKEFDDAFYERSLSGFRYLPGSEQFPVRTIGVVLVPRPAHLLVFTVDGSPVEVTVPPTYLDYSQTAADVIRRMNDVTSPRPHFAPLHAPLKSLAVRTGLASYGRNNITYHPVSGSYHQLVGFVSDLEPGPLGRMTALEPALSPQCEGCRACRQACPTGAISDARVLLHGERCVTYLNEYEGAWPSWVPSFAHTCLVGCLACQKVCPQNAGRLCFERVAEPFTSEETAALLDPAREGGDSRVRQQALCKLARIGLDGYESVLPRNLKALLKR